MLVKTPPIFKGIGPVDSEKQSKQNFRNLLLLARFCFQIVNIEPDGLEHYSFWSKPLKKSSRRVRDSFSMSRRS